jgi:hypothetical protein
MIKSKRFALAPLLIRLAAATAAVEVPCLFI